MKKTNFKLLVCSDNYCDTLIKEGFYQNSLNYHEDENSFSLTIIKTIDVTRFSKFDIIVFDYGLIGDLNCSQLKILEKTKNLFVSSAMPREYIRQDGCYLPYVDFRFELMYIDLIHFLKEYGLED